MKLGRFVLFFVLAAGLVLAGCSGGAGGGSTGSTAVTLVGLAVTPTGPAIALGTTQQFAATATLSDGSTVDATGTATWSVSSVTGGATITAGGLATGTAVGRVTVQASAGGLTASTPLEITAATLQSLAITPPAPSVPSGLQQQFIATGTFSDGTTQDLTSAVTWTATANTGTATISNAAGSKGLATAGAPGTVNIRASLGGIANLTTMTVTAATLSSLSVTPASTAIALQTTQQYAATGLFSDGTSADLTAQVTWSVGNGTGSATIDAGGLATGTGVGQVTVIATLGSVMGSTPLNVTSATLASLAITPFGPSVADGFRQQFTATGTFSDNTTQDLTSSVTWSATDGTGSATISNAAGSKGLATATSPGTVTIGASVNGVTAPDATLTVTAATLTSIDVTPASTAIALQTTQQYAATGLFSDGSSADLTAQVSWSVVNGSGSASITAGGLATGTGVGQVTIEATLSSVTGSTPLNVSDATLSSLAITPPAPSVADGLDQQFTATGTFSDGTLQDLTSAVTWSATDGSGSATISNAAGSKGLATGASPGTVTIGASVNGVTAPEATLTVTAATLASLDVTPAATAVALQTTQQYAATGFFSDGTSADLTAQVSWSVVNGSGSASITAGGLATGTGVGQVTIQATLSSVTGSTPLNVSDATLSSLAITPPGPSVADGLDQQFTATGTFSDGTLQDLTSAVTWSATDGSGSATISNAAGSKGLATATSPGTVSIGASVNGVSAPAATLTVTSATLSSLAVTPASTALALGTSQQYTATGTFSDGTSSDLTTQVGWSAVAGTGTASITAGGLATATGEGQVTIQATLGSVTGSTPLNVTDATLVSIAVTPGTALKAPGTTLQLTCTGTFSDATTQDLTSQVTWTSDNALVSISNLAGSRGLATLSSSLAAQDTATLTATSSVAGVAASSNALTIGVYLYCSRRPFTHAVAAFSVDTTTGALTSLGSVGAGNNPIHLVVEPFGRFLYTSNNGAAQVQLFTIDPATGTLTSGSTVATGTFPRGMAIDPTGTFLYVAEQFDDNVAGYTLAADGTLAATAQGRVATGGTDPEGVAMDPRGRFLYVTNQTSDTVSAFKIDPDTGALTATSPATFATGDLPQEVTVDATGNFLYVVNANSNTVSSFVIDQATGALTATSPSSAGTSGSGPERLATDPLGRFLFASNENSDTLASFLLGADGALTATSTPTVAVGDVPTGVAVDPTGNFVYVANFNSANIRGFSYSKTTGNLTATAQGSLGSGNGPNDLDTTH